MKKIKFFQSIFIFMLPLLLCSCGGAKVPDSISENSLIVSSKGKVTEYITDTFDKDFYDIDELKEMALEEAQNYNDKSGESGVEVLSAQVLDGKAVLETSYNNIDTYNEYNDESLSYASIEEAALDGETFDIYVTGVKNSDSLYKDEFLSIKKKHVLISDVKAVYYMPYKVLYMSKGLILREDGSVDASNATGEICIITK